MKHLPKHLRPRRRYLAVAIETWPNVSFGKRDFQRECWYAAQNLLGDSGSADADLRVIDFELGEGSGLAIIRVRHGEVERARAALACIDAVGNAPVGLRVRGMGGTIRACEERYKGRATREFVERNVAFADARRPAAVRGGRVEIDSESGFVGATTLDTRTNH